MCVFKTSGGLETALRSALSGIMHIYVGINRQNALKYSNVKWLLLIKLLRLRRGMCLCFPRQIYDCCTAINFKSVFIPVTFIGIIADILYPLKKYAHEYSDLVFHFFFFKSAFKQMPYSVSPCRGRILTS